MTQSPTMQSRQTAGSILVILLLAGMILWNVYRAQTDPGSEDPTVTQTTPAPTRPAPTSTAPLGLPSP